MQYVSGGDDMVPTRSQRALSPCCEFESTDPYLGKAQRVPVMTMGVVSEA